MRVLPASIITLFLALVALHAQAPPPAQPALRPQSPTDIHLFAIANGLASLAAASPQPLATEPGYDNQPFFDPDGQRVLYTGNRDGKQTDIFEFDRRTRATRPLTRTPEGEYSPTIPHVRPARQNLAREGFTAIRVEADGTQRLWQFDRQGGAPQVVFTDIKPVGYHTWIDGDRLALYVLGTPATLQLASVARGSGEVVARDIGRTLRLVPGTSLVSFVQREPDDAWAIKTFDPETRRIETLTRTVAGSLDRDYAWMPDGKTLLMSAGTTIQAWT
ncbi:MAG: PD40 domain-containing protein, partial [Acidobacteria bacterium]|nr:PD40 domain-containing protein [Acidobacteriota bacterium]